MLNGTVERDLQFTGVSRGRKRDERPGVLPIVEAQAALVRSTIKEENDSQNNQPYDTDDFDAGEPKL